MIKNKTLLHLLVLISIFLGVLGLCTFNTYYNKIYDSPKITNAEGDFQNHSLKERSIGYILNGEWEFYYNKFLVSDNLKNQNPDCLIKVPSRWTAKKINDEWLPKKGKASYRMSIINVEPNCQITITLPNPTCKVKAYINDSLVFYNYNEEKKIYTEKYFRYQTNNNNLEIIIEVESDTGGLSSAPWLLPEKITTNYWENLKDVTMIAIGIAISCFISSILMYIGFKDNDKKLGQLIFLLATITHLFFSRDMASVVFKIEIQTAIIFGFISGFILLLSFAYQLYTLVDNVNKKNLFVLGGSFLFLILIFIILYGTNYMVIPAILSLLLLFYFLKPLVNSTRIKKHIKIIYLILFVLFIWLMFFEFLDYSGVLVFGANHFVTGFLLLLIIFISIISFLKITAASKDLIKIHELEKNINLLKQKNLNNQIKPHFIFNSLTAIQNIYRKDINKGEEYLIHFSNHLRSSIYKDNQELIPFKEELKNINNYFELENIRANGNLKLLLDINYDDFKIPSLSIQPFIENAIKHGRIIENPNGYVSLSIDLIQEDIIIIIEDNGVGFDVNNTTLGIGISNSIERLKHFLLADVIITSQINEGSKIVIKLKKSEN